MKLTKRSIFAAIPGAALLALATPAGANEARRLCGPEVELFGILPHLDVEVNGQVFQSPKTGEWSITFEDDDGQFTVRYFNESGDWGSRSFDIGPAQPCEEQQPATTLAASTAAPTPPSTAAAPATLTEQPAGVLSGSAEQPAAQAAEAAQESAQELPATGSNAAIAIIGAMLALTGGTVVRLVTRRNDATSNPA